jgi:hypothetical protein
MDIKVSTETKKITNDDTSANWFRKIITNNEIIESLENDLKKLDEVLKQKDKTLILSFDQLDFVVKPEKWSEGIAPLISSWRTNIFSKIYPKIFVRADLYENKLGNILMKVRKDLRGEQSNFNGANDALGNNDYNDSGY